MKNGTNYYRHTARMCTVQTRKEKNMENTTGNCYEGKCGEKKHIKGICCNVRNCEYHDCDTHCTATEIAVGPSSAQSSADTACATFKQKHC